MKRGRERHLWSAYPGTGWSRRPLKLDTEGLTDGPHRIGDSPAVSVEEIPSTVHDGPGIVVVGRVTEIRSAAAFCSRQRLREPTATNVYRD